MSSGISLSDENVFSISKENIALIEADEKVMDVFKGGEEITSIEKMFKRIGYEILVSDKTSDIIGLDAINYEGSVLYSDFIASIAPYVKDGSYLECSSSNEVFRDVFKDGKIHTIYPTIIWENDIELENSILAKKTHSDEIGIYLQNDATDYPSIRYVAVGKMDADGLTGLLYGYVGGGEFDYGYCINGKNVDYRSGDEMEKYFIEKTSIEFLNKCESENNSFTKYSDGGSFLLPSNRLLSLLKDEQEVFVSGAPIVPVDFGNSFWTKEDIENISSQKKMVDGTVHEQIAKNAEKREQNASKSQANNLKPE